MKLEKSLFVALLSIMFFFTPQNGYASADPMYKDWMKNIDDNIHLNNILIPGTHDSATYKGTGGGAGWVKCQDKSFRQQMNRGIRWFDIRLRLKDSSLRAHHGKWYLDQNFNDEIKTAKNFLKDHPTETIIFMISQEYSEKSGKTFAKKVHQYINKYDSKLFYLKSPSNYPQLKDIRGKIVIFRKFPKGDTPLGYYLHWKDDTHGETTDTKHHKVYVQDNYHRPNLDDKYKHFKYTLKQQEGGFDSYLFINFASYYTNGHTNRQNASRINPKVDHLVKKYNGKGGGGLIMLNFPWDETNHLVKHIIEMNKNSKAIADSTARALSAVEEVEKKIKERMQKD